MTPDTQARIDAYVRRLVAQAPPLTDAQRHVISTMFRTARQRAA